MKVSILTENITSILPLINKVLPTRPQVPILSNIYLSAGTNGLVIRATDLEIGAEVLVPAKIEEEGAITVPGKEFIEAISSLPKDKVVLTLEKDVLTVSCRGSKVKFNTIAHEEFPTLYKEKGNEIGRFTRAEFVDTFSNLTFSVSMEETRPQLTGVYVDSHEGYVNFVSTDGYRMSIKKINAPKTKLTEGLIIAVALINEVMSLKSDTEIVMRINKAENQILFEVGDVLVVGRMIEGAFPDYQKVVPEESSTVVTFSREDLLQNVKLASVFAKEASNIVSLEVVGDSIKLKTQSQGVGEGEAIVECQKEGEDNTISFNIKYLYDVLKALNDDQLVLKLNSSTSPALFEAPGRDFQHVIMPIQVD